MGKRLRGDEAKWPCPRCGGHTKVYDSVFADRWRECKDCGVRFITIERLKRFISRKRTQVTIYSVDTTR